MRRPVPAFGAALLALVLAAVPAAAKSPDEVAIRTLSYDPVTVDLVAQGTTVRWSNVTNPNRLHDVVSSLTGYFQTSLLSSGECAVRVRLERRLEAGDEAVELVGAERLEEAVVVGRRAACRSKPYGLRLGPPWRPS